MRVIRARRGTAGGRRRRWWAALDRGAMLAFFVWAVVRYDTFIFRSSTSFFQLRELGLLRRLGKRVLFVYLGSDSRPSYLNGSELASDRKPTPQRLAAATAAKRDALRRVERYATAIVAHAPSAQLHARPFVSFLELGIPYPVHEAIVPDGPPRDGMPRATVRALHAPSDAAGKGTAEIQMAVERLRASGLPLELREVSGQPNAVVLREIAACDFVIDQAYSDTPMATFAAEAAAQGKAAVVGGYGWDALRASLPAEAMPPAQRCLPESLESAIRELVVDARRRQEIGETAQRFVRERWSPEAVGRRYLAVIDARAPAAWAVDPQTVSTAFGVGVSRSQAHDAIAGILAELGVRGLCLDHNPAALAAALAAAEDEAGQSAPTASFRRDET